MNRNEYIEMIKEQTAPCVCGKLSDLENLAETISCFDNRTEQFSQEADFKNIRLSDSSFYHNFDKAFENLDVSIRDYLGLIRGKIASGDINIFYHSFSGDEWKKRKVSRQESDELIKTDKDAVITLNCSGCGNQIDFNYS